MVFVGDGRGCLVDAAVADAVDCASDFVLLVRIRDDFFALEHQLVVFGIVDRWDETVMGCSGSKTRLLCAVRAVRICASLQIVADFVEAFLGDHLIAFPTELATKNDSINKLVWVRLKITAALDTANPLEPKRVPDSQTRHIGLVDEVEDRIRVTEFGCPLKVDLAHETADTTTSCSICDQEATVAYMATSARVVRLHVKASKAVFAPVNATGFHL